MFNLLGSSPGSGTRMHNTGNSSQSNINDVASSMNQADLDALPGELARRNRVARLANAMRALHAEAMKKMDQRDLDEVPDMMSMESGGGDVGGGGSEVFDASAMAAASTPTPIRFHAAGWKRDAEKRQHSSAMRSAQSRRKGKDVAFGRSCGARVLPDGETGLQQQGNGGGDYGSHQHQKPPVVGSPASALRTRLSSASGGAASASSSVFSPSPARAGLHQQHHSTYSQQQQQQHWAEKNRQKHLLEDMEAKAFVKAQRAFENEMRRLQRQHEKHVRKRHRQQSGDNDENNASSSSSSDDDSDDDDDVYCGEDKKKKKKTKTGKKKKKDEAETQNENFLSFPGATESERFRNAAISLRSINLRIKNDFEKRYRSKLEDDADGPVEDLSPNEMRSVAKVGLDLDERSKDLAEATRKYNQARLDSELMTGELLRANATIERYKGHIGSLQEQLELQQDELGRLRGQLAARSQYGSFRKTGSSKFGSWRGSNPDVIGAEEGSTPPSQSKSGQSSAALGSPKEFEQLEPLADAAGIEMVESTTLAPPAAAVPVGAPPHEEEEKENPPAVSGDAFQAKEAKDSADASLTEMPPAAATVDEAAAAGATPEPENVKEEQKEGQELQL